MKKRLLIIGALIIIGFVVFLLNRQGNRNGKDIILSGNIEVTEADLGFKYGGRIAALYKDEGQIVAKGESLALLDSAEIEGQADQSRALLNETRTRLNELKAGSRPQELTQAKAQVANAEAELIKAKSDYERYSSLYEKGVVAAEQRDAMKKSRDVATAQHQKALEALSLLKEGPRREEIQAAGSRVHQAEAAVKVSEERLKETVLTAPLSGIVLQKNAEKGEIALPGIAIYTIGDLQHPWIKIYVKEDKLGLVRLGQKAEITTDSYPGKKYEGVVTFISSEAEFTPKNVQTREERVKLVFGVKVSVKNMNDELKPGMPADVTIYLK
ncbi:MAG: efflux RND transporter periplasmic adaptor subunit [Nitrospirae bacterium]|nr:efflux RND transporter periplasmic adaptor subunit [Nitrospirota bacterium]